MKKTFVIICGLFVLFLAGIFISRTDHNASQFPSTGTGSTISVVASFYPVAEFSRQVGGDLVTVTTLTPAGVEPHDFEPSPRDLASLYDAQVFVYNGAGFEPWLPAVTDIPSSVVVVDTSAGTELLTATGDEHNHDETLTNQTQDRGDNVPMNIDPHIWLDPVLAQAQVTLITQALITADPANAEVYQRNATHYLQELQALDSAFKTGLTTCQTREIVTSHNAFQYLARRYNITVESISGLSPDEEPTPKQMAAVTDFVRQHQVKYIFFESLVNPRLASTIAQETGAQTISFNPLEGLTTTQLEQGETYLSLQRANLKALQIALGCS